MRYFGIYTLEKNNCWLLQDDLFGSKKLTKEISSAVPANIRIPKVSMLPLFVQGYTIDITVISSWIDYEIVFRLEY